MNSHVPHKFTGFANREAHYKQVLFGIKPEQEAKEDSQTEEHTDESFRDTYGDDDFRE